MVLILSFLEFEAQIPSWGMSIKKHVRCNGCSVCVNGCSKKYPYYWTIIIEYMVFLTLKEWLWNGLSLLCNTLNSYCIWFWSLKNIFTGNGNDTTVSKTILMVCFVVVWMALSIFYILLCYSVMRKVYCDEHWFILWLSHHHLLMVMFLAV